MYLVLKYENFDNYKIYILDFSLSEMEKDENG